jgi:hypothetical protein
MRLPVPAIVAFAITLAGCAYQPRVADKPATSSSIATPVSQLSSTGSYLIQPPLRRGNPDPKARLADWQVLGYFDHPAQCDAARAQGLAAYGTDAPATTTSPSLDSVQESRRLASLTACIASNDPRINWFYWTSRFPTNMF